MSKLASSSAPTPPVFLPSYHQRSIYNLIRTDGPLSRADVVRRTHLTFPSISRIIDGLIRAGLLTETRRRRGGMGKPPTELEAVAARAFSLGVAYSDTCLRAVLIDLAGHVVEKSDAILLEPDVEALLPAIVKATEQLEAPEKVAERTLAGVGVALPASVLGEVPRDSPSVDASGPAHPLAAAFHQQLGCPVVVETIATAGAVGERWLGSGRDLADYYYLAVGDDVSGALMVRGRPYRGSKGNAGALGHAAAVQAGAPNPLAAVPRLFEGLRAAGQDTTVETMVQRLESGDELLLGWLGETAAQLAPVLVALECLLDPQAFVLGGTLPAPLADALLEHLVKQTKELRVPAHASAPEFLRGMTGDDAMAIGAATLPLYRALSPEAQALFSPEGDARHL